MTTGTPRSTAAPAPGRGPEPDEEWLDALTQRVVADLTEAGRSIAVAESLTGGAVAARLTDVPGASVVLRGGVVAYATDLKAELLGVDADLLAAHGAVHPEVARQMADGVRGRLGADLGAATTGVAGPAAQDGWPPGTLHVAVSRAAGTWVRSTLLAGTRRSVRRAAIGLLLALVTAALEDETHLALAEQHGWSPR